MPTPTQTLMERMRAHAAIVSTIDGLAADLEKAKERVKELETENQRLKTALAAKSAGARAEETPQPASE